MSRPLALLAAALCMAVCAACSGASVRPPRAEFLVATPDSTYWVSAGRDGMHVRGVPMTLARYGGRFHEVYVANLDNSFDDAIFTGERLYVRDILTNDSVLVYDDTQVVRLAAQHAKQNPDAQPMASDDEDAPQDPDFSAQGELDILDVRGPVVLLEHRFTIDRSSDSQSDTTKLALDLSPLRERHPATLVLSTAAYTGQAARTTRGNWRDAVPATVWHDSAALPKLPFTWHRPRYTLLARGDSVDGTTELMLRDSAQQLWPVLITAERSRIYWLDDTSIDTATRNALARAFNGAATYDEGVKYVRFHSHTRRRPARFVMVHDRTSLDHHLGSTRTIHRI